VNNMAMMGAGGGGPSLWMSIYARDLLWQ